MRLKPNAVPTQNLPKSSIELVPHRKIISSKKKTPIQMQCPVRFLNLSKIKK